MPGGADLSEYNLDGVDLVPYLTGEKQGAPHEHLVWRSGPNRAVRKGPWKLLVSDDSDILRLYHVDQDPTESNDRSTENPEKVEELKAISLDVINQADSTDEDDAGWLFDMD